MLQNFRGGIFSSEQRRGDFFLLLFFARRERDRQRETEREGERETDREAFSFPSDTLVVFLLLFVCVCVCVCVYTCVCAYVCVCQIHLLFFLLCRGLQQSENKTRKTLPASGSAAVSLRLRASVGVCAAAAEISSSIFIRNLCVTVGVLQTWRRDGPEAAGEYYRDYVWRDAGTAEGDCEKEPHASAVVGEWHRRTPNSLVDFRTRRTQSGRAPGE